MFLKKSWTTLVIKVGAKNDDFDQKIAKEALFEVARACKQLSYCELTHLALTDESSTIAQVIGLFLMVCGVPVFHLDSQLAQKVLKLFPPLQDRMSPISINTMPMTLDCSLL